MKFSGVFSTRRKLRQANQPVRIKDAYASSRSLEMRSLSKM